jgi:hypothetical protein
MFPSAQAKLSYASSFLRDNVAVWFRLPAKPGLCINFALFQEFSEELRAGFAVPEEKASAERKISDIRQEGSVPA